MISLRRRLTVLIYHQVLDVPDPLRPWEVDVKTFDIQVRRLSRWYTILPLKHAIQRLQHNRLPVRSVAITFDDGYANNLNNAVPILKKHGASASFYVATGFSGGGMMFNDLIIEAVRRCKSDQIQVPCESEPVIVGDSIESRKRTLYTVLEKIKYMPVDERLAFATRFASENDIDPDQSIMMTADEIRDLRAAGMELGAHTQNHPILQNLSAEQARKEISSSKAELENILQEPVAGFAYPNGRPGRDFGDRDVELVRSAGFDYAVTTGWASAREGVDPFRIPRISLGVASGVRPMATVLKSKLLS